MQCPFCSTRLAAGASFCDNCGNRLDPLLGRLFGEKFQMLKKLGEGGFGAVYEAEEKRLSRKVAVKTLHAHISKNPKMARRFLQEAVATSQLEHPNIVKIYDFGETTDGIFWMAMEYLTGEPLDGYLRKANLIPPEELMSLMGPVCEALGEAHLKGIVHRDVKPANIMLISLAGKLVPKVLDFGISKLEDSDSQTQTGALMGTPQYMPPEQWESANKATPASDVYALGVMLYQMLSGRLPLLADSKYAWMKKHCEEAPAPLAPLMNHPLAGPLSEVVMRCLAKRPSERPANAYALKEALEQAYTGHQTAGSLKALAAIDSKAQTMASLGSSTPLNTGKTAPNQCERCDLDHARGSQECPASRIGQTLSGKYEIEALLGAGGMGAVYRAKHLSLQKKVALKMLLPRYAKNETINKRFEEEARRAASLKHPGIVEVTDLGRAEDGSAYMEMEILEGKSVADLLKEGELSIDESITLMIETTEALSFAHSRGVIHRDLKPDNLFRARTSDGSFRIKIVDFGIAKAVEGQDASMTQTGSIMGTPIYMSLEQATDTKRVDQRSDLYSLGATFYELLTRRHPVSGATINELLTRLLEDRVERSPRQFRGDVPIWVDAFVTRAMGKTPESRFQTAQEMLAVLRERRDVTLQPNTITEVVPRPPKPKQTKLLVGVGVVALGAVAAVVLASGTSTVKPPPPEEPKTTISAPPALPPLCTPQRGASWQKAKGAESAGSFSAATQGELCGRALLKAKENAIRAALCIDPGDEVTNPAPPIPVGCEAELYESVQALSWKAQIIEENNVMPRYTTVNGQSCEVEGEFRVVPLPSKRKCEVEIINLPSVMKQRLPPDPPEQYLFTAPKGSERRESGLYIFTILPGAELTPMWGEGTPAPTTKGRLIDRETKAETKFSEVLAAPLKVGSNTMLFSYNGIPAGKMFSCEVMLAVAMPDDKTLRVKLPTGKGEESKRLLTLMKQIEDSAGSMEEACWTFLPYKIEP